MNGGLAAVRNNRTMNINSFKDFFEGQYYRTQL